MNYEATARYVRGSTRRFRLLVDAIKTLSPIVAVTQLLHVRKSAAVPLRKVIASALANAKQKQADEGKLQFERIEVMGGPFLKRFHAVSRGQGHQYKKRMTHIRVVVTDDKK